MRLRTTVFAWVLALVLVVLGAAMGTIYVVLDRSTRARVASDLARSKAVALDLQNDRLSLARQECRVVVEEPRLKAVVATEDIERSTILDAVRTLADTTNAGVFVLVDPEGKLIADHAAPLKSGESLAQLDVVAKTLATGNAGGVWVDDKRVYLVHGCRLEFGAQVVGALVIGHALDDEFASQVGKHTGGLLVVTLDKSPTTKVPDGVGAAEMAARIDEIAEGKTEVTFGGTQWYGQSFPIPGYDGKSPPYYVLLHSIDEALAPARALIRLLLFVVGGAALASLVIALLLARRLGRPIDALVARTSSIASGDLAPRKIAGPTEIVALGAAMDKMATELDQSRTSLLDKQRLEQEMAIAARIQTSILPRNLRVPGLEIAAAMKPASEVGGDYYDVIPVEDGAWLAIGDASGHGVTSGLVMMMVQTGFGALVHSQRDPTPVALVRALNRVLYENIHERLEADRHMTLSLMRYRPDGSIALAGAHMDAVVWRAATKSIELLPTPGTFLAIAEDIDHVNVAAAWQLQPGDVVVLLSDGVTEAENPAGVAFEYEGVTKIVEAHATAPVAEIRDAIFSALAKHSATLADDATLLVLRHVGTKS